MKAFKLVSRKHGAAPRLRIRCCPCSSRCRPFGEVVLAVEQFDVDPIDKESSSFSPEPLHIVQVTERDHRVAVMQLVPETRAARGRAWWWVSRGTRPRLRDGPGKTERCEQVRLEGNPQDGDSLGELRQVEKAERSEDMSGPAVEAIRSACAKRTSISIPSVVDGILATWTRVR